MNARQFAAAVGSENLRYRKVRTFAALLGKESGLGAEGLTIVGGSALEVYTEGDYASEDVDLVADSRERVERVLDSWGFLPEGKFWIHRDLRLWVEIVDGHYTGSRTRNRIVSTPYGEVRLASLEDIVWKRTIEARAWNRPTALEEARLLVRRYGARLDWAYIEEQGRDQGISGLVADLRKDVGRGPLKNPDARLRRE